MPQLAALESGLSRPSELYTTSALLLLAIRERLKDMHRSRLPLGILVDEVFYRDMRERYGAGIYDVSLTPDGHVKSSDLADDLRLLIATGDLTIVKGKEGPEVELTSAGWSHSESLNP